MGLIYIASGHVFSPASFGSSFRSVHLGKEAKSRWNKGSVIKGKSCLPDPRPRPGSGAGRAWEAGSEPQWFVNI